jgi:hypothetical protein
VLAGVMMEHDLRRPEWMRWAACRHEPHRRPFVATPADRADALRLTAAARRVCLDLCPVLTECAEWASTTEVGQAVAVRLVVAGRGPSQTRRRRSGGDRPAMEPV